MTPTSRPVVLVDRDGTLVARPEGGRVDAFDKLRLLPGAVPALMHLSAAGFDLVLLSRQPGLGEGDFPEDAFSGPDRLLLQMLESCHVSFREVLVDRSPPGDGDRTSPDTAMLVELLRDRSIDWERSAVIGDEECDLRLARSLGVTGYQLGPDGDWDWSAITHDLIDAPRTAEVSRVTPDTQVDVFIDLDAATSRIGLASGSAGGWGDSGYALGDADGPVISTGVGFLDSMLTQLASHSGVYLEVRAVGDLHNESHRTVEDTAVAVGEAFSKALGARRSTGRYGFTTPVDDALAVAALDLTGRPQLVFEGRLPAERVGDLPTEMVIEFWRLFCDAARLTLHVRVEGHNAHHMVEASYRAVGRALRQAMHRTHPAIAVGDAS